jgi:cysteine desulfurase
VIYLDYNATTPVRPEALAAMARQALEVGNPSSLHAAGQRARVALEASLEDVAALVGAGGRRVVLTGSGSEANDLAVVGLGRARARAGHRRLLVSAIEHPCVRAAAEVLAREGLVTDVLPVGASGMVELSTLADRLGPDVALVAVMLANNETGVLQPLAEVARLAAAHGVPVHTDAVQAAGKIPIDFGALGVASLALAGHKLGGPKGVGALVLADGVEPEPLWDGGGQQGGLRSGTPAVTLAAGLAAAARASLAELPLVPARAVGRDTLQGRLLALAGAFAVGHGSPRLPNTLALGFEGVPAQRLVEALSARGVAIGAGAACHTGEPKPSSVLLAMGVPAARALEVNRFSSGFATTAAELEAVAVATEQALGALRVAA